MMLMGDVVSCFGCKDWEATERSSGGMRESHPLIGLWAAHEVVTPSQPMCVTCCTSVGHPISMSISASSKSSSFSTAIRHKNIEFHENLDLNIFLVTSK